MKDRENNQPKRVLLPPAWCGAICRNAMNELCIEHCAIERDCSAFDPKPKLKLEDMPRFPLRESANMTKEEKFTSVTVYLSKVVDHLKGIEDEHTIYPAVRRSDHDRSTGGILPANVQVKDLLSDISQADSSPEVGEKREDSAVRPSEVAGTSD